jgi:hypothetical protein
MLRWWKTLRWLIRSKADCCLDQMHGIRWRIHALHSAIEMYGAIGRRGRLGIHVYWSSLDAEERNIYMRLVRQALSDAAVKARSEAALRWLAQEDLDFRPKP